MDVVLYIAKIEQSEKCKRRDNEEASIAKLVMSAFGDDAVRKHDSSGAPFILKNGIRLDASISISHSRYFAVMAVAQDGCDIGVDIESDRIELSRVCRRILDDNEYEAYRECLVRAWTAKEALYKATRRYFDREPEFAHDISISKDLGIAFTPDYHRRFALVYTDYDSDTICLAAPLSSKEELHVRYIDVV